MNKTKLSQADRYALEFYLRTQNRPISFLEVFRLYVPRLAWEGAAFLLAFSVIFAMPPTEATIPVSHAVGYCLLAIFAVVLLKAVRISYYSIGHWELLKRILDWSKVHKIMTEAEVQEPSAENGE